MKCPNCGKEIADNSQFCEFCGAQLAATHRQVSSTLVAWIMFLLTICFSATEMVCLTCINNTKIEYARYVSENVVQNTFLLIAFINISVFVICFVLGKKNLLRTSTSIALCLMSAILAIGAIASISTMKVGILPWSREAEGIMLDDSIIYSSIFFVAVIAGVYGIYWLIAKAKHLDF